MLDRGPEQGSPESRLVVPLAAVLSLMWVASGIAAIATGQTSIFAIASGPFTFMCSYVYGRKVGRRTRR